jgi:hypothetical protein
MSKQKPSAFPPASLQTELDRFRETYRSLFGVIPPLPENRMALSGGVAPEFSLLAEQVRAHALAPQGMFDVKLIQLICFGMLLVEGHEAAYWHALAARRNGASWQELHKIVELATVVTSGFGALNRGGALLAKLQKEEGADPKRERSA